MLLESMEAPFADWDITVDLRVDQEIHELPPIVRVEMQLPEDPHQQVELESNHRVHHLQLQELRVEACMVFT